MPGGSDVPNLKALVDLPNLVIVSISLDMQKRLRNQYRIHTPIASLNLVDKRMFPYLPPSKRGTRVFVYNGRCGRQGAERIYNQRLIDAVVAAMPEEKFVFSNDLHAKYEDMPAIYASCRIGLRLTPHDGNANMVQEMESMGIPVVHNQSDYGLKWKSIKDVIKYIKESAL